MRRPSNVLGVTDCPDRVLYFPSMLTERFERALVYAMVVHGGAEDEAIGALLHDAAEDGGGEDRFRDIEGRFGCEAVAYQKTGHHSKIVADLDALVTQLEGFAELNSKWSPDRFLTDRNRC